MSSCYSGDHIAEDHIHKHTEITTSNIEKPQQSYRIGTVSDRLYGGGWGGLNMFS